MSSTAMRQARRLRRRYATFVALLVAVTVHAAP
ncbi:MAG: hypothetical protein RL760_1443, partial [Candidatus Eisenbacteria bacterium]